MKDEGGRVKADGLSVLSAVEFILHPSSFRLRFSGVGGNRTHPKSVRGTFASLGTCDPESGDGGSRTLCLLAAGEALVQMSFIPDDVFRTVAVGFEPTER